MFDNVKGKVILITGASSGNSEAARRHLAESGAVVVLAARREDCINALQQEVVSAGHRAVAIRADVSDKAQVKQLVDTVVQNFGRVDVMLNNAGVMPLAPLEHLKTDEWDQMIDVNLQGALYGIAATLAHMQRQMSGHNFNVSSVYGHKMGPDAMVYCAIKFAVRALSEGLRQEVKPYNIRTTIISPGLIATELLDHIIDQTIQAQTREFAAQVANPPDSFARMIEFAVNEPENVDVNEILFRPTAQPILCARRCAG